MASQRVRVFKHRAGILRMLDEGETIRTIKDRVGLDDMPYATFYRHVAKFRDAPRPAALDIATALQAPPPSPAPAPVQSSATETTQPEAEKPMEERERKRRPRKRKFVDANAEYEKEHGKSETPAYDPRKARDIK